MVEYRVENTSNIRKFVYGEQIESGESKEIDILVKEAEEIPRNKFNVERIEEPGSSQDEEPVAEEQAEDENQDNSQDGGEN